MKGASPFACGSRVTSRDSSKCRACSHAKFSYPQADRAFRLTALPLSPRHAFLRNAGEGSLLEERKKRPFRWPCTLKHNQCGKKNRKFRFTKSSKNKRYFFLLASNKSYNAGLPEAQPFLVPPPF